MPTNPTQPNANAAIDRLTLGVDSPRGVEPSFGAACNYANCFEAEPSIFMCICCGCSCFEAEPSNGGYGPCSACFETE